MEKKPLYRKVNTRARGVYHHKGGDYRHQRNSKNPDRVGMKQSVERGLDYTPLFKFLLSKVGSVWSEVHSEAVSRLDKEAPIYWMVSENKDSAEEYIRAGENSYYSGLYVDAGGILRVTEPEIGPETLDPCCKCCTHTFNGVVFTKKYQPKRK
ncbi:hypothetical protein [Marinomonas sp. THO17]|uniref:hypothetical protein n=1 Tax=Marinomonas sp. THO17 TaxID=3149048 RepID=UPI00336BF6FC